VKIYLAAKYTRNPEMREHRALLESYGHDVTSRWINGDHETSDMNSADAEWRRFANEDLADVRAADCMIWFSEPEKIEGRNRGGRHVEFGIALAWGIPIYVVGRKENVFHFMAEVKHFSSLAGVVAYLGAGCDTNPAELSKTPANREVLL